MVLAVLAVTHERNGDLRISVRPPRHPDQHRPKPPVLLAVDQEFAEGQRGRRWLKPPCCVADKARMERKTLKPELKTLLLAGIAVTLVFLIAVLVATMN